MKHELSPNQRIALTLGEPAGIGADLCVMLAQRDIPAECVVVGSKTLLEERAALLKLPIAFKDFDVNQSSTLSKPGTLTVLDVPLRQPVTPGTLHVDNSAYVMDVLKTGYDLCAQKTCRALLTLPVHKAILAKSGEDFTGHTEYFAKLAGVNDVLMTFYTPAMIVALATTHIPLQDVSRHLTSHRLKAAITLLQDGLKDYFNKPNPRIGVLGLNPHAGENGLLGHEEQEMLSPLIASFQQRGDSLTGPLSGDTAFSPGMLTKHDALLAMYHDQGLAPIKALYFGQIVNVTLGLPFLRVSVDHGTALDKAGTGNISMESLETALRFLMEKQ